MRNVLLISFLLLTASLIAQDCREYYPTTAGESFVLETYNRKDKLEARAEYEVLEATSSSMTYLAKMYDKKEDLLYEMEFDIRCEEGRIMVDMQEFVPPNSLEQMKSMDGVEVEIDGDYLEFPAELSAGMELEDASITVSVSMSALGNMMSTTVDITDRKVEGMEMVETPMGNLECFKVTQTTNIKAGFLKSESSESNYIHPEKGFVKSETFNKKGKLDSYTIRVE